jgi:phage-related protein
MNLFELFVKIGVKDEASKNLSSITSKLGNGLKTAAKIGTAAVTAASTAVVALTKNAVENFAEYEQLVGGVDTLFKESSQKLQNYAKEAYKTAGMSANEYMATATGFSASLLQSLAGDTAEAADYADRAIRDMSDNANKMGTDMELIKNAYQGFAKQNYTMLDNLKLGYGGTKEEMERLIIDASKMTDIQKELGITVDASSGSFSNVVNAISVMQKSLGIAGTTAKEATMTIEGSLNSMKAAWQNVLTAFIATDMSLEDEINNLVETIAPASGEGGVINNLLPRIEIALEGVGSLIDALFPVIIDKIPTIIESILPRIAQSAVNIVQSLGRGINENKDSLVATAFTVINTLVTGLLALLPDIIETGLNLVIALAKGIAENLDTLMPAVIDTIMKIVEILTAPDQLSELLDAALVLLLALSEGLVDALPKLVNAAVTLVSGLVQFLLKPENISKLIGAALQIVLAIVGGLIAAAGELLVGVGKMISTIKDGFKNTNWGDVGRNIINKILAGLKSAWESVKSWFTNAWNNLFSNRTVSVGANVSSSGVDGSHAGGLDYVPFDGYVAELHKGEQVLTAEEARDNRRGGKVVSVVQNIYSQAKTAADLMQEAKYQQERAVLFGV